jgi:hypothetical protein
LICEDDFDDAASSTLSSNLSEESGDWEYTGDGEILENGTINAVVICNTPSQILHEVVAYATFAEGELEAGDKPRVIVGYLNTSNYLFVEAVCAGANSTLAVWQRVGGTNTKLREIGVGDFYTGEAPTITACVTRSGLAGYLHPVNQQWVWSCGTIAQGRYSGIGNGAAQDLEFDLFSVSKHYNADPDCFECQCECDFDGRPYNCIPWVLLVTVIGEGECTEGLTGTTFEITYDPDTDSWKKSNFALCGPNPWNFEIKCHSEASSRRFVMDVNVTECDETFPVDLEPDVSSTCEPISWVYTGFEIQNTPLIGRICPCCDEDTGGSLTFVVTKP